MVLSDIDIKTLATEHGMIAPFIPEQVRQAADTGLHPDRPRISYGLTSAGYDFRLCPAAGLEIQDPWGGQRVETINPQWVDIHVIAPVWNDTLTAVDPKNFNPSQMVKLRLYTDLDNDQQWWELPSLTFALGLTVETFQIPKHIIGMATGKSTYARCGIYLNFTPAEPGWGSRLVVELFNAAPHAVRIYANEGIGQMTFQQLSTLPEVSYADRPGGGKYQNQTTITYAKV